MSKFYAKIAGLTVGLGALTMGLISHAAVDSDIASSTTALVTSISENVKGVIVTNLPTIGLVAVMIFTILFVWRFAKRFIGGR